MSGVVEDMAYYKNIVQKLKVADLQNILAYVGKRSNGRKTELQARVLNMIRSKNPGGMLKIKEIYAQLMAANQARAPPPITPPVTKSLGFSVNDYFLPPMSSTSLFNLPVTPPSNVLDSHMAGAVHPDVKFRRLPFYDLIDVLMRPASLAAPNAPSMQYARNPVTRQQQYQFYLSPQHLKHLQNKPHQAQIQVRLCKIEPTEQDDAFPNGLSVRVNNKNVTLPNFIPSNKQNVPSKRPPEPLNITSKCLFSVSSPTKVFVTWDEEYNSPGFALGIFLVDKLDSADLIHRLKSRPARPAEFTMGYIKEKYNSENDSEIKTLELTSSLICPLGKMRMAFPTKASTCAHLQCFDGATFIKMNELKPKWNCPVCDKPAYYDTLSIDGYFYDIIRACPKTNEIQLRPDGTWSLSSDQEKESSGPRSANVEAHRYSPINMSTKDVPAKATSSSSQDAPDIITLDSESDSNDSEDPAIVSDDKFSTSSTQLSSKPLKKRFRPDTGTEEEVDLTMCVDLTEDSGDERGGRSRGSAESNGGVTSASATNGVPSEDTRPHSQPWLGFYGGAEGQVSSSGDALSLTSEDRAVPSTEPQTTPGSEDLTTGPKIAAGPPPPEYETLDHVSGEFSNFTRSYSQAYHSKGSSSSDTPVPSIDNPTPPPPTPLPLTSPQVSSTNDVITLEDSLSPPPLPQAPVANPTRITSNTGHSDSSLPPELVPAPVMADPLATNSLSNSPARPARVSNARRIASDTSSDAEGSPLASRIRRRPLRLNIRPTRGRRVTRRKRRRSWTSDTSEESDGSSSSGSGSGSGSVSVSGSGSGSVSGSGSESSEDEYRVSDEEEDED